VAEGTLGRWRPGMESGKERGAMKPGP